MHKASLFAMQSQDKEHNYQQLLKEDKQKI
jgi:hypothetical protein